MTNRRLSLKQDQKTLHPGIEVGNNMSGSRISTNISLTDEVNNQAGDKFVNSTIETPEVVVANPNIDNYIQIKSKNNNNNNKNQPEHSEDDGTELLNPLSHNELTIKVENLSKLYKVYPGAAAVLREVLFHKEIHTKHWALKDVSFSVHQGEIVGVVGANGAGKSTLLRILAGVLEATSGNYHVQGQLRAILQLGTGFHEEYTGLENIYMGGYCLGYTKDEIEESLDWIIDFSGLGNVINQQFRTYSSGMKSRLTFSVTFCRSPKILIIDEALSAGDLAFQHKCTNRIIELCSSGATALVVSHGMYFIEMLCSRAIYLKNGVLVADGDCRQITRMYEKQLLEEFSRQSGITSKYNTTNTGKVLETGDKTIEPDTDAIIENSSAIDMSTDNNNNNNPVDNIIVNPDDEVSDPAIPEIDAVIQELLDDPEELCPPILHLELVELKSVKILNGNAQPQDMFHTGEQIIVEFELFSKVEKDGVAVGIQIFNENEVHVATTTNMVHLDNNGKPAAIKMNIRRGRQVFRVIFPRMFLADGKYYINIGMNPKLKHFSEADQLLRERRVATFGMYRADTPWKVIYDPPSIWQKLKMPD